MEEKRKIGSYLRDRDFPLALVHIESQSKLDLHSHDYYELVYVVGGKGSHYIGSNRFAIGECNVFLIPPGVEHGYGGTESLELYNLLFRKEEMVRPVFDLERMTGYQILFSIEPFLDGTCSDRRLLFVDKKRILDYLVALEKSLSDSGVGWRYISKHLFDRVLYTVIHDYLPVPENSLLDRLGRVMPFIQEQLGEDLTLPLLCAEAGMSRSSLARAFQQVYRMSPMEKVQEMRIEKAASLLRDGTLRIQEAGDRCGFSSSAYFSRVFREKTGLTPSAYRKRYLPRGA